MRTFVLASVLLPTLANASFADTKYFHLACMEGIKRQTINYSWRHCFKAPREEVKQGCKGWNTSTLGAYDDGRIANNKIGVSGLQITDELNEYYVEVKFDASFADGYQEKKHDIKSRKSLDDKDCYYYPNYHFVRTKNGIDLKKGCSPDVIRCK